MAILSFRGWHPHDEGTLGLAASSVLRGEIPHVDFYDMYSGLQAYVHGGAFAVLGESIRTLRIVGALVAGLIGLMSFRILRRKMHVLPASLIASATLVFGYLAYPSSMPTWWNVALGLAAADRLLYYSETGRLRHAALAGALAGIGILIKSTGLYFMFAMMIWILSRWTGRARRWLYTGVASVSTLFMGAIVVRSISTGAVVLVLMPWIVVCVLGWDWIGRRPDPQPGATDVGTTFWYFSAAALFPVLLYVLPYVVMGELSALWNGWVVYPSLRFRDATAGLQLAPSEVVVLLLAIAVLILASRSIPLRSAILAGSATVGLYAFLNWGGFWTLASTTATLAPLVVAALLGSAYLRRRPISSETWLAACLLSAAAFVQLPLWGTVYTMYVAPIAVVAASLWWAERFQVNWLALGIFGIALAAGVQMGLGKLYLATPDEGRAGAIALTMDRGGIRSPANYAFYNDLIEYLERYEGTPLYAGPDSPEVYFLAGALNPSGVFFEVLVPDWDPNSLPLFLEQHQIEAVVLKVDRRFAFSEAVPPEIVAEIETVYPHVTRIGWFLVYEKEARV